MNQNNEANVSFENEGPKRFASPDPRPETPKMVLWILIAIVFLSIALTIFLFFFSGSNRKPPAPSITGEIVI